MKIKYKNYDRRYTGEIFYHNIEEVERDYYEEDELINES